MEQESSGSTSDRNSANPELPDVVEYLDKLDEVCVAKTITYEEQSQRRAAEPSENELEEVLFTLSEAALLQWRQILLRVTIHQPVVHCLDEGHYRGRCCQDCEHQRGRSERNETFWLHCSCWSSHRHLRTPSTGSSLERGCVLALHAITAPLP